MNVIWSVLILSGIFLSICTHNTEAVSNSILNSAKEAVELLLLMSGIVSMWNGILKIAEDSRLVHKISEKITPFILFLFPRLSSDHHAIPFLSLNFITNMLGLGWACTPIGLRAMTELQNNPVEPDKPINVATDEMCTFLVLNISSLQLIPINIIAYRTQYGSTCPFAVVGPALLATSLSTFLAIILCKLFSAFSCRKE